MSTESKSKVYGFLQSLFLSVFAGVVLLGPEKPGLARSRAALAAGNLLCAAGIVLLLAAIRRIGQSIQIAPAPKTDAVLVTTGIYRWFRHPIYTSILILVVGLFLRKPALWVAAAGTVVIVFLLIKARFEEKLLRARYPDYAGYLRRSWGIVPGLR